MTFQDHAQFFLNIQERILAMLAQHDPKPFLMEDWDYQQGQGGGRSCVLEGGEVLEKAGVNYSHVSAAALPQSASSLRPHLSAQPFCATGVSVVIHPANPYVPTSHFNVRLLQTLTPQGEPLWWFGGGFDLTPFYPFTDDCVLWHEQAREACAPFGVQLYPRFKAWCDEYFYLKHRQEARGIGGIFFDDFNDLPFTESLKFIDAVAKAYIDAYAEILSRRKTHPYGARERAFQTFRRGRYVEFNLLYDRGTLFGLQSGGRTESILMSLPPEVSWHYNWQPEPGSPEALLYEQFLPARNWLKAK